MTKKRISRISLIFILSLIVLLVSMVIVFTSNNSLENTATVSRMTTSEFEKNLAKKDFVSSIKEVLTENNSNYIIVIKKDGTTIKVPNPNITGYTKELLNSNIYINNLSEDSSHFLTIVIATTVIITIMIVVFIISRLRNKVKNDMNQMGKGKLFDNFKFKFIIPSITFKNVAGNKEAIENFKDYIDFVKNPRKYEKVGARIPKGIIMYGPSGTGKTLIAKAFAGECNMKFIATAGSEFVEKYVGVGASRIRELFTLARQNAPCIIFIDEIDALCTERGNSNTDEKDQTLNQLLVEMDGIIENENIFIIGATNRYEMLDKAVLRPGRFDRHIKVDLPDVKERVEILSLHSKNKPLSVDVDLKEIAKITTFMSGAELENVLNEASILCAKTNSQYITMEHLNEAISKVIAGDEKLNGHELEEDKKLVAYHEAGHALVAKLLKREVPKITIKPTTKGAGGYTLINPLSSSFRTKTDILNSIKVDFGGRIAEEIVYGKDFITGGASADLKSATSKLEELIKTYGLGDKLIAKELDKKELYVEMNKIAEKEYQQTLDLVIKNKDKLEQITLSLLENETIFEEELDKILKDTKPKTEVKIKEKKTKILGNVSSNVSTIEK